jgi:hypothetical protein
MFRDSWRRHAVVSYWTESGIEKDVILQPLLQQVRETGHPTLIDSGWKPWDLAIDAHLWSRVPVHVVVENHGGAKRLARFKIAWEFTPLAKVVLCACGGLLMLGLLDEQLWMVGAAVVAALAGIWWVAYKSVAVTQQMREIIKDVAAKLTLVPLRSRQEPR